MVCRWHDVFLWSNVRFVVLRFHLNALIGAAALRLNILRYASAPIATRVFFRFLEMSLFRVFFSTISAFSLYGEYVVRSFLSSGVFQRYDHGLDFLHQLMSEFNQSIKSMSI